MDNRRTFYKIENGVVLFRQINFEYRQIDFVDEYSVYTSWGSNQKIEGFDRVKFDDVMKGFDHHLDTYKKYKAEYNDRPWKEEMKITINLEKKNNSSTKEEFDEFLKSIPTQVEDLFWKTIIGEVWGGLKKIKGSLYSIRIYLINDEPAMKELIRKWVLQITENADIVVSYGQEKIFTQIPEYSGVKDLEIEFWTENHGFIFVTLTLGEQIFETRFSDVFDPNEDLRRWLEAICIGVEECSFSFSTEGDGVKLNFCNWRKDRGVFYVGYERDAMNMVEHVNRYQFVKAFYNGYLDFLNPDTFTDKKNWDLDIADKFKSKIIEEYLLVTD